MSLFLRFKDNNEDVDFFEEEGSDLKYFEAKAGELHTEVDQINEVLTKSLFHIETVISGKDNYYKLTVKIKHYADRTEHEHKKNTHRQEVDI